MAAGPACSLRGAPEPRRVRSHADRRGWITISAVLAVGSVAFTVIGPKIVGNATNVIFDGIIGKLLPAGVTKAQAVAGLRARGQNQIADLVSGSNVLPGHGIDFTKLGDILALAALVYVLSALLGWMLAYIMAGVAQRTVFRMRRASGLAPSTCPRRARSTART